MASDTPRLRLYNTLTTEAPPGEVAAGSPVRRRDRWKRRAEEA